MDFKIVIIILLVLAGAYLYINKPVPVFDEKPLRDSIERLKITRFELLSQVDSLQSINLSLSSSKQQIRVIYRDRYKFLQGADIHQLDSIIRLSL